MFGVDVVMVESGFVSDGGDGFFIGFFVFIGSFFGVVGFRGSNGVVFLFIFIIVLYYSVVGDGSMFGISRGFMLE